MYYLCLISQITKILHLIDKTEYIKSIFIGTGGEGTVISANRCGIEKRQRQ